MASGALYLAVSVVVMIAGVNIAKDTLAPLIGEAIDPEVYREITRFVESYPGIVGTHDLIVHNYGPGRSMASIHAEVPSEVNVEISHEIIDQVERDAQRKMHLFLVIHMDPIETQNERVENFRKISEETISQVDSRLSLHDFRIVDGKEHVNLIFDLVVPRDYTQEMKSQVKRKTADLIQGKIPGSLCMITVENSYCAEKND